MKIRFSRGLFNWISGNAAGLNKLYPFLIMIAILLAACSPKHPGETELIITNSRDNDVKVYAALAVSPAEKRNGLSQYDEIGFNEGMLFIYGNNRHIDFDMRGARNDLSVAYMDSTGIIKEIFNMIIDPNIVYRSAEKCRYALQMAYGWFMENEILAGDSVQIAREIRSIKPLF